MINVLFIIEFPTRTSLQVIYCTIFFFAFFAWSIYSACFVSDLTVFDTNLPFKSVEGFLADGSYKLAVIRDSADDDFIRVIVSLIIDFYKRH